MTESASGADVRPVQQPRLPFWQVWNVSLGFLGVQFGFALQNANASRILSDLGADLHSLSFFWIVAPLMGLIVQPIVGSASDRTWNRFGRRSPYILFGAIAAALGMALMPNAGIVVAFVAPILFGGVMLALMDAAFNVTMQPFRALVSDMVPSEQRTLGYSVQSLLINIGAVCGSILPFVLTNVIGLENSARAGEVAPSVIWAFYIGGTVLLGSVLWTVIRTKEYPPAQYAAYKGIDAEQLARTQAEHKPLSQRIGGFLRLLITMPKTMRQLAVVQFFSWFALFIMWVYTTPAITQHVWGVEAKWFDSHYLESVGQVPAHIAAAKGAAGDWVGILFAGYSLFAAIFSVVLAKVANTLGRKLTYALSLLAGGAGYISFLLFQGGEPVAVNLLITEVTVPSGALGLLLPMVGVGIAWAAILAMPYAILSDSLPADKTGVYMGIFNFTIAAPQILSALVAGPILAGLFGNQAIYILVLAGVFMALGAVSVFFVREAGSEPGAEAEEAAAT
ncbi:MFS transporter [Microbulbifer thermotolerans]|uniref:MFS transporter n=1 Tax=Microbulbifer thermotolerans TaxID=252514 RepID=A0A143HP15_MICTH|nr:MFS transporter [Microbulbifer thermotolerans]AMX03474.1 MFS transporter [Microbulbifer thermotolerans]MCX2780623.1 MFS transporter [Microbulbifer thermotolerans]MCX2783700.1 MFS transporter [Microbulbifer thermotolerans]MCX2795378.1 MFS transporter [Microbulbifer thermotolerans]MCX2806164.1 MFS transporter [Microbulbifer thermotolerans]